MRRLRKSRRPAPKPGPVAGKVKPTNHKVLDLSTSYSQHCGLTTRGYSDPEFKRFYALGVGDQLVSHRASNDLRVVYSSRGKVNAYLTYAGACTEILEWKARATRNPDHFTLLPDALSLKCLVRRTQCEDTWGSEWYEVSAYKVANMKIKEVRHVQRVIR